MGEISVKTGNNARNGGKNSLNRLIRCVCGKKIGPDPRNFNQRVSLGRNDLLIRTFPSFYRSSRHQEDAESWISLTNGKGTHLGLWHTHPELTPTPSDIDMADYNNVIKNATLNSGLIYIIIGTQELKIWYGIKPCQLIPVGTISLDKL
ncbi:Mov34/MPN/PAD-1 family protein [Klebsiella pneumoniae]